jgi:hypothetical protein
MKKKEPQSSKYKLHKFYNLLTDAIENHAESGNSAISIEEITTLKHDIFFNQVLANCKTLNEEEIIHELQSYINQNKPDQLISKLKQKIILTFNQIEILLESKRNVIKRLLILDRVTEKEVSEVNKIINDLISQMLYAEDRIKNEYSFQKFNFKIDLSKYRFEGDEIISLQDEK